MMEAGLCLATGSPSRDHALDRRPLEAVPSAGVHDLAGAERAVRDLLDALGVDLTDEGVRDTPNRVARMYGELLTLPSSRPLLSRTPRGMTSSS